MASDPQEACDKILKEIRTSNLHFMVQESPYSIYLTLRKRFFKNTKVKTGKVPESEAETELLKAALEKKEKELIEAKNTIKLLESKLDHSEEVLIEQANKNKKQVEKVADENKILKNSINKFND